MVFSSLVFLCIFLPVVRILYGLLPGIQAKNGLLIVASLVFYAYGEPVYVLIMIGSIVASTFFALVLAKKTGRTKQLVLLAAVLFHIGMLAVFKYADMALSTWNYLWGTQLPLLHLPLPIGISFFTFQALSYIIDVYRGEVQAQKSIGTVMLYISFFPQLIAGPIVKYHDIEAQISQRHATVSQQAYGMRRLILGLAKKVLLSNTMAVTADALFAVPSAEINILTAWLAALSYLFQIYFDFSGYSDMAIGLGQLFGFQFQENFRYPYAASSIQTFWRRWHISLSTWFREYVYIPLGGNRCGSVRTGLHRLLVFFLTGLWHGASWTFVVWGLWHGLFLLLEQKLPVQKLPRLLSHGYTMLVVLIGFVMFRSETFSSGLWMISRLFFGWSFLPPQMSYALEQITPLFLATLFCCIVASTPLLPWCRQAFFRHGWSEEGVALLGNGLCLLLLPLCLLRLFGGSYNPFIYFRF